MASVCEINEFASTSMSEKNENNIIYKMSYRLYKQGNMSFYSTTVE